MAVHKGIRGVVKIGDTRVAEVKSWSIDITASPIDTTSMDNVDRWKSTVNVMREWSGSLEAMWDKADPGQKLIIAGDSIVLKVMSDGANRGDSIFEGGATVTGVNRTGSVQDVVQVSFNFEGNGPLTEKEIA